MLLFTKKSKTTTQKKNHFQPHIYKTVPYSTRASEKILRKLNVT